MNDNLPGWSYLCRWHFYYARLRKDNIAWGDPFPTDDPTMYHCDWKSCKRKPYREVFPMVIFDRVRDEGSTSLLYVPLSESGK